MTYGKEKLKYHHTFIPTTNLIYKNKIHTHLVYSWKKNGQKNYY
jgi:hypothetical protein